MSRRRTTARTATSHRADSEGALALGRSPRQASFAVFQSSSSASQSIFVRLEYYLSRLNATKPAMAPDANAALEGAVQIANEIADCAPLGVQTSLVSAHLSIDQAENEA